MIIVTGTKRSGTSMWMQILKAAGLPVLGDAFPSPWGETLRDANRAGFYETSLREGIYYATNPHPRTGAFLSPRATREWAVKVFARGMIKTDLAYAHRVLATMRPFREYAASLERLYAMERAGLRERARRAGEAPERAEPDYTPVPPVLEWWGENYRLLRDALTRRYPLHMASYASVLRDPEQSIGEALAWIGKGDRAAAVRVVARTMRTQHEEALGPVASGLSAEHERLFEELYARVDGRIPLDAPFIDRLNAAHDVLGPKLAEAERAARRGRRKLAGNAPSP